jgi:hypothetical protein
MVRSGSDHISYIHFGPKAAKLYKTIAGRRATVGCGTVTPEPVDDVLATTGFGSSQVTLAKHRTRVFLLDGSGRPELCIIATRRTKADYQCFPMSAPDDKHCIRVIVALPDPDAAPPAGKVGYWTQGEDAVYSSLLADGKRAFLSMRGGVYSTNLEDLMGPREDAFSIF